MRYVNLGRSGLKVSVLCLGTMNFGVGTDESEACKIMDTACDAGINIFDSADVYGVEQRPDIKKGSGLTEEIIGRWLAKSGKRNELIIATKLHQPMGAGPNDRHLSALHIRQACEASLRRLGTDHIDLYFMHHIDRETPWEEIWQAMELLWQQGKVIYFGSSNFAGWHIATAQAEAMKRNFMGLVAEESPYNLANRAIEMELIPALSHYGLGLMPYSPLAGGLLAGNGMGSDKGRRSSTSMKERIEKAHAQLTAYDKLCAELGYSPSSVALAWLLRNPAVVSPIIGPHTSAQLAQALDAADINLSKEILDRLDAIWPGPGGEAPEAYAW